MHPRSPSGDASSPPAHMGRVRWGASLPGSLCPPISPPPLTAAGQPGHHSPAGRARPGLQAPHRLWRLEGSPAISTAEPSCRSRLCVAPRGPRPPYHCTSLPQLVQTPLTSPVLLSASDAASDPPHGGAGWSPPRLPLPFSPCSLPAVLTAPLPPSSPPLGTPPGLRALGSLARAVRGGGAVSLGSATPLPQLGLRRQTNRQSCH